MDNARYLSERIKEIDNFEIVSNARHIPVITFKQKNKDNFTLFDLSSKLRSYGWIVPAYSLPKNADDTVLMRVVIRESFSNDMVDLFIDSLNSAVDKLKGNNKAIKSVSPRKGHFVS